MSSASHKAQRIAILAHALRVGGGLSGGKNLIAALGRVAPQHEYLFTIPAGLGYEEICSRFPRAQTIVYDHHAGLFKRWLFETFQLGKLVAPFRPDVLLALGSQGLPNPPCPQAVMVRQPHFFYPLDHYRQEARKKKVILWYGARRLGRVLRNTQLLLCQTPVAQRRLVERYQYKGRTAIVSNAVSAFAIDGDADHAMPERLISHADRMKLFCLTKYYAHKNLEAILDMYSRFPNDLTDIVVVVTVAANHDPHAGRFLRSIEELGLGDRVVNVGPLPQQALASYYRNCQALFLPTLLESFSVAYLEAMHFGVPILTSDLDFARYVCDDAAIYFDPWNTRSMRDAILRLKADTNLARELVARGRARLQTYFKSWDEIAANVVTELEALCV